jgi:hypothetical protein
MPKATEEWLAEPAQFFPLRADHPIFKMGHTLCDGNCGEMVAFDAAHLTTRDRVMCGPCLAEFNVGAAEHAAELREDR